MARYNALITPIQYMDSKKIPTPVKQPISPWKIKPWWCQPWSIMLTGLIIIGGSWVVFKAIWLTILVAIPISAWMGFFLLVWPQLMINSGMLDTYEDSQNQR